MDFSSLIVALAALILLAVTSQRFGVDSREGWPGNERTSRWSGFSDLGPEPPRGRPVATASRIARPRRAAPECAAAPCGA
jgi:hypothetical protein